MGKKGKVEEEEGRRKEKEEEKEKRRHSHLKRAFRDGIQSTHSCSDEKIHGAVYGFWA
jgi:hypothetical protein